MGATVLNVATSAATDIGTIAMANQLKHLRERVLLSKHGRLPPAPTRAR